MLERGEIRRRLLLKLFGSPVTLVPAFAGALLLFTPVFFQVEPAIPAFLGITGLTTAALITAIRGLTGRDRITREIEAEAATEAAAADEARLKALGRRLAANADARASGLFADLTAIREDLRKTEIEQGINVVAAGELRNGIEQLFEGCTRTLEKCVELQRTSSGLHTKAAREALLAERERLLAEVERSVERLTCLLTELRMLSASGSPDGDLTAIATSLSRTLDAARATEEEAARWTALGDDERAIKRALAERKETN